MKPPPRAIRGVSDDTWHRFAALALKYGLTQAQMLGVMIASFEELEAKATSA